MHIPATIAERTIIGALARGELDNLPGAGKPLAMDEGLSGVPAELRIKVIFQDLTPWGFDLGFGRNSGRHAQYLNNYH
jgi:hypothetical protein